jgi:hypothetical protein
MQDSINLGGMCKKSSSHYIHTWTDRHGQIDTGLNRSIRFTHYVCTYVNILYFCETFRLPTYVHTYGRHQIG